MMRYSVILALIFSLTLCTTGMVLAQDFSFAGSDVVLLANTITEQTEETYQLPSSYQLPVQGDRSIILTAPMAFEILARALVLWKANGTFPAKVTEVTLALHGPALKPENEPASGQKSRIPVIAQDIVDRADAWLQMAKDPRSQNGISARLTLGPGYKLTAAQYLAAMAMVISQSAKDRAIPIALAIPAIASPKNWDQQDAPIPVGKSIRRSSPEQQVNIRVTVNGIELPKGDAPVPPALSQTFCGPISIAVASTGGIKTIAISMDGESIATLDNTASTGGSYIVDSARFSDDIHMLSVTAIDADGDRYPVILTIKICNGRTNNFTPALIEKPADPLEFQQD